MERKVLYLTLTRTPFEIMLAGIKHEEYRLPSKWIASRLEGKSYTHVRFTNGYGSDKDYFEVEYRGFVRAAKDEKKVWQHGDIVLSISVHVGDYVIRLGKITKKCFPGRNLAYVIAKK